MKLRSFCRAVAGKAAPFRRPLQQQGYKIFKVKLVVHPIADILKVVVVK